MQGCSKAAYLQPLPRIVNEKEHAHSNGLCQASYTQKHVDLQNTPLRLRLFTVWHKNYVQYIAHKAKHLGNNKMSWQVWQHYSILKVQTDTKGVVSNMNRTHGTTGSENSNSDRKKTERKTHWWSQTQKDTKIGDGNIEKNPREATHGSGFGNPISFATKREHYKRVPLLAQQKTSTKQTKTKNTKLTKTQHDNNKQSERIEMKH